MRKFLFNCCLLALLPCLVIAEDYPVVFDKTLNYAHASRRLNSVSLNGSVDGNQSANLPTPLKIYSNITNTYFTAKAGETVTPVFGFTGTWMNGFVYIDFGQDGNFDATLNANGSFAKDGDIMAFSYAEPTPGSSAGYNSNGVQVSNPNVLNPPAFKIPANIPNGYYLMRYKVDWASIDPAGRPEDGNGIIKNGGAVCDIRINIHGDNSSLSVIAENGSVSAIDGSALPAEVPFGQDFKIKITPAEGYVLDHVKVRHGYNLNDEALVHGVAQHAEDIISSSFMEGDIVNINGLLVDGDVVVEPVFVQELEGADGEGYAISFDSEAEGLYNGNISIVAGDRSYEMSVENCAYLNATAEPVVLYGSNPLTVNIDDSNDKLNYYMYIDFNNDGKFSALQNPNGEVLYSNEHVATATSTKGLAYTFPNYVKEGVYRVRLKADVDNYNPAGSENILSEGGAVADFIVSFLHEGAKKLELNTVNGSINGENYSALPVWATPFTDIKFELMPGAPGFEAKEVVVRYGINIDGEQYINGNKQWGELVIPATSGTMVLDGDYVYGDVRISADFEKGADCKWNVVFADEFNAPDGTQPSSDWWVRCQRQGATWNRWLSDSEEVVYIEDGKLVTRAIPNPDTSVDNVPMITGGIWSRGKFGFTYGRIEGRIKTHGWTGNFPAFWMMPEDQSGGWPNDGEIDIWEVIDAQEYAYHTVHSKWTYVLGYKNNPRSSFNEYAPLDRYHVFTLEWDVNYIRWFLDGKQVGEYKKSTSADALANGQWPFDDHFHIILNQSVGNGSWAKPADVTHTYETLFDWVRVYQKEGMENTLGTVGIVNMFEKKGAHVEGVEGGIVVSVSAPADVVVYDIVGRRVAKAFVDGAYTFSLPSGIYVVDNNKVIVK